MDTTTRQLYSDQDDLLIAIVDERPIWGRMLIPLPPWRAWLVVRVMEKANHPIEDLNYGDIHREAVLVGGSGTLNLARMLQNTTKGK